MTSFNNNFSNCPFEDRERFLARCTLEGLRSLLIIHGRGLSSPGEPVLKTRLRQLLGSNRGRKWILAFTSARSCDGGTGATYVLLRNKPLPKKHRKNGAPDDRPENAADPRRHKKPKFFVDTPKFSVDTSDE